MQLSPEEEGRRIPETEKNKQTDSSTTSLSPNVAGLLCYLAGWITGIVFLLIEQRNKFVRFHAAQSIIVFGALNIINSLLSPIPVVGWFFNIIIGILGILLTVKIGRETVIIQWDSFRRLIPDSWRKTWGTPEEEQAIQP